QLRLEQEELQKAEDEARRRREERERARGVTTIVPQAALDPPLALPPPASGSTGDNASLPKQAERIAPGEPAGRPAAKRRAPPLATEEGVIRLGPDDRLPLPGGTRSFGAPERVEQRELPPPD